MTHISDDIVEKVAKRIARSVPLGCGGGWNEPHGHDFPHQYSDREQKLIRSIARDALETAALAGGFPQCFLDDRIECPDPDGCALFGCEKAEALRNGGARPLDPAVSVPPHDGKATP